MELFETINNDKQLILQEYQKLMNDQHFTNGIPVHLITLSTCTDIMPLDTNLSPILNAGYKGTDFISVYSFLMDLIVECGIKSPAIRFGIEGDLEIYNLEMDGSKTKMRFTA